MKKLTKRLLAMFLAVMMVATLSPTSAFAAAAEIGGAWTAYLHDTYYYNGEAECYLYLGAFPANITLGTYVNNAEDISIDVGEAYDDYIMYEYGIT